jgi:hypothetical protein
LAVAGTTPEHIKLIADVQIISQSFDSVDKVSVEINIIDMFKI